MSKRPPSTKVFIGNLPDEVDEAKLRELFESVGQLAEFDIIKNYGFAHYETEEAAKQAVSELHETNFEGSTIRVEQSRSSVRHKPGMGSMTECYRCGKDGHWSKDCPLAGPGERRGRGRGRGGRGRGGYDSGPDYRDPYDDPYDPYYRRRLPPPPAYDRYHPYDPYERRRLAAMRDPYYLERDPYARPPADYYERLAARDAYYDYYAARRSYPPPPRPGSPPRSRVPGPY